MGEDTITQLLIEYRYWILIPLSLLEGPIAAFAAGTLASLGFFNIWVLAAFFFARDVGLDAAYYGLGHWGGQTAFVQRMMKKLKLTQAHLESVRALWIKYPGRTMLVGKLSYGIASAFIVVAGMVRMPLKKFFFWAAVIAVGQYGLLLALGYFLGNTFGGSIAKFLENLQYVVAAATILISAYYIISWRMRGEFLREEKEAEDVWDRQHSDEKNTDSH